MRADDIVTPIAGGPLMTVCEFGPLGVRCCWYHADGCGCVDEGWFAADALEIVQRTGTR